MTTCLRCIVSGRVQGVFFRASTQRQARQLGVTGYAKNLPDGSVEVLACGDASAVQRLAAWLRVGPPAANVTAVECEAVDTPVAESFTIF
jgi:acylphosphatase